MINNPCNENNCRLVEKLKWMPHAYNLLWTFYLRIEHMNQLTWWCWTSQCMFYTITHFQYNPIWKRARLYLNMESNWIVETPALIMIYGGVHGIVWFVFLGFCFIIFHNPTLVCLQSESDGSYIEIMNILVHYYIVSGIMIWTVYRHTWVQYHMIRYIDSERRYRLFSISWLPIIASYLSYWKFNFAGIAKNYHLDTVPTIYIVMYFLFTALMCIKSNIILAYITQYN